MKIDFDTVGSFSYPSNSVMRICPVSSDNGFDPVYPTIIYDIPDQISGGNILDTLRYLQNTYKLSVVYSKIITR